MRTAANMSEVLHIRRRGVDQTIPDYAYDSVSFRRWKGNCGVLAVTARKRGICWLRMAQPQSVVWCSWV